MSEETGIRKNTAIKHLTNALKTVQDYCIGIAVIGGIKGMIIEYDYENEYMRVITPLSIGGMTDEYIDATSKYVDSFGLFPDMTLTEMLNNPDGYSRWCKDYSIK